MADRSVRVQLLHYNFLHDKKLKPIKAYRLRMKDNSTFGDLASTVLARYAKEDPKNGGEASVDAVLDETNCAVEMNETLDLVGAGEILKLVLAKSASRGSASFKSHSEDSSSDSEQQKPALPPGKRPAVKAPKPLLKFPLAMKRNLSQPDRTIQRPSPSARPTKNISATPVTSLSTKNPAPSSQPLGKAKGGLVVTSKVKNRGKPDPYDIPSDSDDDSEYTVSQPSDARQVPKSLGKRALSHTVNAHLDIVDASNNQYQDKKSPKPAYMAKNSKGLVPIYRKGETPSGSAYTTSPYSGSSSTESAKRSRSQLHSPLTTSRLLMEKVRREKEEREEARKRVAEQELALKRAKEEEKARTRANMPQEAIAHIKAITNVKFTRKQPDRPIPESFFEEPEHSDEDLGDIITGSQYSMESPIGGGRKRRQQSPSEEGVKRRSKSGPKLAPIDPFTRINTLYPAPKPKDEPQTDKTFGAGYSKRVRDVFSDSQELEPQAAIKHGHLLNKDDASPTYDLPIRQDTSSPLSADTDTTSILITKQLLGEAPPSNQELGMLMSSSPSRRYPASYHSCSHTHLPPPGSEQKSDTFSSSEPRSASSAGVPSRVTSSDPKQPQQGNGERNGNESPLINVECGTAERPVSRSKETVFHAGPKTRPQPEAVATPTRAYRFKDHDVDLDVTPTFELALSQIETPSTRARSTRKSPCPTSMANSRKYDKSVRFDETNKLVVKIPLMSTEQREVYARVLEAETNEVTVPLKSFKEINHEEEEPAPTSQDSGAMALQHVLNESPGWLTKITEIAPGFMSEPSNQLRSRATDTPSNTKRTGIAKMKRTIGDESDTNDADPAYSPPVSEEYSDSSRSDSDVQRKSAKCQEKGAPLKDPASQAPSPSKDTAIPTTPPEEAQAEAVTNKSSGVSCTPVPAPTIASLLENIRKIPKTDTPNQVLGRPKSQAHTAIPPPVVPVFVAKDTATVGIDNSVTPDQGTKRKREKRKERERKKRKQQKGVERNQCQDMTFEEDLIPKDENESTVADRELPCKSEDLSHFDTPSHSRKTTSFPHPSREDDEKLLTASKSVTTADRRAAKKQKNRERKLRNKQKSRERKLQEQQCLTTVHSTPLTQPSGSQVPRSNMDKKARRRAKRLARKQAAKSSGYGQSPSLPPMMPDVPYTDERKDVPLENVPDPARALSQGLKQGSPQAPSYPLPTVAWTDTDRERTKPKKRRQLGDESRSVFGLENNAQEAADREKRNNSKNDMRWRDLRHGSDLIPTQNLSKPMSPPITSRPSSRGSSF